MASNTEDTLQPSSDVVGLNKFTVEYTTTIKTNEFRKATRVADFTGITVMKSMFASVTLLSLTCEARQNALAGTTEGDLELAGHIFVAVIPSNKNTDSATGTNSGTVTSVPNKKTFPLALSGQSNHVFDFNLSGYELDLAVDARRGAAPVAWIGNSGVRGAMSDVTVCTVTWRAMVQCSGSTPLWV